MFVIVFYRLASLDIPNPRPQFAALHHDSRSQRDKGRSGPSDAANWKSSGKRFGLRENPPLVKRGELGSRGTVLYCRDQLGAAPRFSYKILTGMLSTVALGYYTGPQTPYMGLPRTCFWHFRFSSVLRRPDKLKHLIGAVSTFCMLLLALSYVLHAWVR